MKTGRSLQDLAIELERQAAAKKDFKADTRRLSFAVDTASTKGDVVLQGVNGGMKLRNTAHSQMAQTLGIPKNYYDRMKSETPDLLARNVNHWLAAQPAVKMVRTLDNEVRAILSDSYRPLDNLDLAHAVLPKLHQLEARVESCEVTESRLYLKAVSDKIAEPIKVGDVIQAGLVVSNSEIGEGALSVQELDFRLACLNGMIRAHAIRKTHVGRSSRGADIMEEAREYFRSATREADDRAFFLKVQDITGAMFDRDRFVKRIQQYKDAAAIVIDTNPAEVLEIVAAKFQLTDGERGGILKHLIQGHDLSAWGYANAVTRAAQDADSYDRSTEMEAIGGGIIELPASAWRTVEKAASKAAAAEQLTAV